MVALEDMATITALEALDKDSIICNIQLKLCHSTITASLVTLLAINSKIGSPTVAINTKFIHSMAIRRSITEPKMVMALATSLSASLSQSIRITAGGPKSTTLRKRSSSKQSSEILRTSGLSPTLTQLATIARNSRSNGSVCRPLRPSSTIQSSTVSLMSHQRHPGQLLASTLKARISRALQLFTSMLMTNFILKSIQASLSLHRLVTSHLRSSKSIWKTSRMRLQLKP